MNNDKRLLILNSSTTCIRFAIYRRDDLSEVLTGHLDGIGSDKAFFCTYDETKSTQISKLIGAVNYNSAVSILLDWVKEICHGQVISAVAHGILFGGNKYYSPQPFTAELLKDLQKLSNLCGEHLFKQILLVETIGDLFPALPQFACFDSAFFKDMPLVSQLLPIPRRYFDKGVRRYGFHGLSCESLMKSLTMLDGNYVANSRVILVHLDNHAYVTAVHDGKCMDTSMSFTLCSGIPSGSCAGDLDPGLVLYLAASEKIDAWQFNHIVNQESGLKGISGTSGNIKELMKLKATYDHAEQAISFFCYQVRKWISAMAGAMGGVNSLVFSGDIGINCAEIRALICDKLEFLGVQLDANTNLTNKAIISTQNSQVLVRIIPAEPEQLIAKHTFDLLGQDILSCELF